MVQHMFFRGEESLSRMVHIEDTAQEWWLLRHQARLGRAVALCQLPLMSRQILGHCLINCIRIAICDGAPL